MDRFKRFYKTAFPALTILALISVVSNIYAVGFLFTLGEYLHQSFHLNPHHPLFIFHLVLFIFSIPLLFLFSSVNVVLSLIALNLKSYQRSPKDIEYARIHFWINVAIVPCWLLWALMYPADVWVFLGGWLL